MLLLYFLLRGMVNQAYWRSLPQRFGFLSHSLRQTGPGAIWLHAVSVGEVLSCLEFLRALRREFPATRLFVSTSTLAGRALAEEKLAATGLADAVFYAPVDTVWAVRRVLREQLDLLHRRLLAVVRDDAICRRLMTVPGVGPVVALTYRATVDVPARFRKSKSVGAVFGLTCSRDQSGERDRPGAISRCGDEMMRAMLYEAAQAMLLRSAKWSWLKAWAMQIARRRGMKRAIVALARRLAVILHRIWIDGTEFRWTREAAAA